MVKTELFHRILKHLEKYLIKKNNFNLFGYTYDLILFIPSDKYLSDTKYSLILSANILNNLNQKEVIKEILFEFKEILIFDEYNSISRLNIIHSEDAFVKNLKLLFAFREEVIEITEILVGGVRIDFAYLVKSLVLDKLFENRALELEVKNQIGTIDKLVAGIIRIDQNYDVVHFTGKGIREMWRPYMTKDEVIKAEELKRETESYLIQNNYIARTKLDNIIRID